MADTPTVDQLMRQIAEQYATLSRQLKIIAKYIEQHRGSLMLMRISDIAETCNVQPSAIVRFAKQFGFSGFSEMQAIFRDAYTSQAIPSQNYQQRIRRLIDAKQTPLTSGAVAREFIDASRSGLDELLSGMDDMQFDAAVKLLQKAENIYVIGVRRSFPIASYIVYALQHTNKRVHHVSGLGGMIREQIRSIGKSDVMIAISFTPYGKETQACVRLAQHHQAKSLVITDSQLSPLARHASVLLTVKEGSALAFRSLTNAMCLCQALFIALAYRLELNVEETIPMDGYDE
ncbi:MurR/RpiR family transcriptional regulator [Collimonas sp.]|jgi:DNA-binding MurR/RpiR family transcriptional regulator|uniref:MurR/RpiR family transcriptional regulator n=1 Tax=Collimonas sp. TaxID=1963772 RepID=UPI0037BE44D0